MPVSSRQSDSEPSGGDPASKLGLSPTLYGELYEIAAKLMRRERSDCSLQSTILVHDAFMALGRQRNLQASDRPVLLAAAAQVMCRLLIDRARARRRHKRGGKKVRESLPDSVADDAKNTDVRELHDALVALREMGNDRTHCGDDPANQSHQESWSAFAHRIFANNFDV